MQFASRFLKGRIYNILGMTNGINLKISGDVERNGGYVKMGLGLWESMESNEDLKLSQT